MTEQNPNHPESLPGDLSIGATLRAAADAELTPAQEQALPHVDRRDDRVTFERDLRDAVRRVMGGAETGAPEALRGRIEAMFRDGVGDPESHDDASDRPGVIRTPMGDTRERSFWTRVSGIGAVAAVLALCATVVVFSLRQSQSPNATSGATTLQASTLASFVHDEHEHCAGDREYADRKFKVNDVAGAVDVAREHFGEVPSMLERGFEDLETIGFGFAGLSRCAVPGKGKSVHIVFDSTIETSRLVSLFIQKDENDWRISDSRCARVHEGLPEGQTVTVWRREGFFFFLFTLHQDDLETFHALLGVPAKQCSLSPVR